MFQLLVHSVVSFITARNEVGARLCFYMCLWFCSQGGQYPSMHCRWYPSMPCSRSLKGRGWYPSMPCTFPGPHPGGKLRGIWLVGGVSRPTPKGEVERDLARRGLQAHTQGGSWGGSSQGGLQAHTRAGVYPSMHWGRTPLMATAAVGTHPTGMHSCFS